ncbi:MAG TPA: DUF192 domain-containing protein [Hadesarchaea archaeon]|nr:DUF192 domain-containing protein [Hadesarchaea archaeon]
MTLCGRVRLVNKNNGAVIAREVEPADTFWRRLRGLMLRGKFPRGKALLFKFKNPGRHSIHMFFVRFPIDLIYLDSGFRVVEARAWLRPWHLHRPKTVANYLIELPAGTIQRKGISTGHKLSLKDKNFSRRKGYNR